MTTNRNETERYGLSREQTDAMFERTGKQLMAEAAERQRASAWPGLVDRLLDRLIGRSLEDREALAAIDARLSALETAMGISRG